MPRKGRRGLLFFSLTYEYLEHYLPAQAGRSPLTVDSYRDALTVFRRFAREERGLSVASMEFGDCGRDLVLSFVEWLRASGCSAGTCNQRVAALKSYLWFAADKDVAVQSVALSVSRVPPVKGPASVRESLSDEALAAIFAQPDTSGRFGVRDLTLMVLLYDSAIRLSELTGLDVGSVYGPSEPHIYVWGKGNKERVVAVTDRTWGHLERYTALFHGPTPDPSLPLFYTKSHGRVSRMSPSNVERIVGKHAKAARLVCPDVPERVYPHMFRRTRATGLYQEGVPLELVSRILGHSSVETTRVYAKPSLSMMRDAMESASHLPGDTPSWAGNEDELARLCGLR